MAFLHSAEAIVKMVEALGLDKRKVAGFTIECRPHSAASVTIECYLEGEDMQTLTDTIKNHYKLVPVEEMATC
jgi:hypothetical protein